MGVELPHSTNTNLITGAGSKRGSFGGASDIGLEDISQSDYFAGAPPPGGHPGNTDQYYADQYDQYYRYCTTQ